MWAEITLLLAKYVYSKHFSGVKYSFAKTPLVGASLRAPSHDEMPSGVPIPGSWWFAALARYPTP
ncbi:MAG: hypothetical protein ACRYG7_21140, partial [Janthinobacterium lividum]